MMDPDRKFGFHRWRVAGLALNLVANAAALYGAVRYIRNGTHGILLAAGIAVSLACILVLARPDRREGEPDGPE